MWCRGWRRSSRFKPNGNRLMEHPLFTAAAHEGWLTKSSSVKESIFSGANINQVKTDEKEASYKWISIFQSIAWSEVCSPDLFLYPYSVFEDFPQETLSCDYLWRHIQSLKTPWFSALCVLSHLLSWNSTPSIKHWHLNFTSGSLFSRDQDETLFIYFVS